MFEAPRSRTGEKPNVTKEKLGIPLFRQPRLTTDSLLSQTLQKNKDAVLDPIHETREYLKVQDPFYIEQLERLAGQITEPMHEHTEIVSCIPVAGTQEMDTIFKTLQSYNEQSADPDRFEILLLVNVPERFVESRAAEFTATRSAIEQAQRNFPKLHIRAVYAALPDDQVRIGNIRKIGTDLALLREQQAKITRDVLLLSNDADNEGLSNEYMDAFITYFKEHPEKEGAVGNLQFSADGFVRFPEMHARIEFSTYLDQRGFQNGNVDLFGSNSVMKSSIYAAIGGYPSALRTAEQEWTGDTIRKVRGTKKTLGYVDDALLTTSARRPLLSHLRKTKTIFGDEAAEIDMRSLRVDQYPMFDYANRDAVARLIRHIGRTLNALIAEYEKGDRLGKNSWFYKTNLARVGITYTVKGDPKSDDSTFVITNIDEFVRRQEAMQRAIKKGETNMAKVYQASLKPAST